MSPESWMYSLEADKVAHSSSSVSIHKNIRIGTRAEVNISVSRYDDVFEKVITRVASDGAERIMNLPVYDQPLS